MKYSAVVTYDGGGKTGATVVAKNRAEAWEKLAGAFNGFEFVREVTLCEILIDEREIG